MDLFSTNRSNNSNFWAYVLRQSINGSDMSYKDMMETRPIREVYHLTLEKSAFINDRDHWVILWKLKS